MINEQTKKELLELCVTARENAYTPYSHYDVGAALLCDDGKIYTGCNIENAAYSPTICAERTAAVKAISEGAKEIKAVAISSSGGTFAFPCGVCRQFMCEFIKEDIPFYIVDNKGNVKESSFYEILPHRFTEEDLYAK